MAACFGTLPTAWFTQLQARIAVVQTPEELQAIVNEAFHTIALLQSTIASQLAYVEAVEALLTAPINPTEVITWIGNFITSFLTPYVKPLVNLAAQVTALEAEVATLTTAITTAEARLAAEITIPSTAAFCTL
jgi:hypothetical protein